MKSKLFCLCLAAFALLGLILAEPAIATYTPPPSKQEDSVHASGDYGDPAWAVRNDAGAALAGTDGDYIPLSTNATGALRVTGSSGVTEFAEDAGHTTGDAGNLSFAVRNDAGAVLAGTDLDYIPLSTDASGDLSVEVGEFPAQAALADGVASNPTTTVISSVPLMVQDAARALLDRQTAVYDTMDVAGAGNGIAAAGLVAQSDDTGTTANTENQFSPVRENSRRSLYIAENSADLSVACNFAAGVGGTCTLPAPAAGFFHYITFIDITEYATAAMAGALAPMNVATTNLPGGPNFVFDTAIPIGETRRQTVHPNSPIKSDVAATATTIVVPGTAGADLWNIKVWYYEAR